MFALRTTHTGRRDRRHRQRAQQGAGARSGAVSKVYRDSLSKKNIHTRYGFQITYNPAVYTPSSSLEGVREADERRLVHVHVGDELGLELRLA